MRVGKLFVVAVVLVGATPALAQSKRYPPDPIDKDQEKQDRSDLWENAAKPHTKPYADRIAEAKAALNDRSDLQTIAAIDKLDDAVALLPDEPEAYALRGEAYMNLKEWTKCADDLEMAQARTVREEIDRKVVTEQRKKLGLCLARAGKLADAERVLAEAAVTGTGTGEMLLRLGEVRIAMGKLDEAIAALTTATDATDTPSPSLARWLLASAYDRARRPSEAIAEAKRAAVQDRVSNTGPESLLTPSPPLLGKGEAAYLLGLAWTYGRADQEVQRPEHALVYFRKFLRLAPDSPWRKRAEEHVRDLKSATLPEAIERKDGGAAFDLEAARAIVRRQMPQMRACVARAPNTVFEITITKVGPRSPKPAPPPPPRHYRYPYPRPVSPPPEGVGVLTAISPELDPTAGRDAAARCLEPIAQKLGFAKITEKDSWVRFGFMVVAQ